MKKFFSYLFAIILVLLIVGSFVFLYKKSQSKPVVYQTEGAEVTDIVKKTVATGSIVPRQSVEVKPKVTGVLSELYVDAGALVKKDQPLGKVSIIADAQALNGAQAQLTNATIQLDNAKRELDREEGLYKQGVVAEAEVFKFRTDYALAKESVASATSNLQLVKEGATHSSGKSSNVVVTATVEGMVIDVPVKVGFSVIAANSFNPGTTIATIANMNDIIFDGRVDEAEVAKIKEGMKLQIKIGAIENEKLDGKLTFIAPQGKLIDGAIQFEIKADVILKPGVTLRANYSANADIVLDEKPKVLAIREALVQYDKDSKPYVEVETSPQTFVRRDVQLGLSDGIHVEVKSGVAKGDKIKIPDNAGPSKLEGSGSANTRPPPKK